MYHQPSITLNCFLKENKNTERISFYDHLCMLKEAGIQTIDFGAAGTDAGKTGADKLAKTFEGAGITVGQTHGPILGDIIKNGENVYVKPIDNYKEILDVAFYGNRAWGCDNMVIHPICAAMNCADANIPWEERIFFDEDLCDKVTIANAEFFTEVLEYARKYDVNICLETMLDLPWHGKVYKQYFTNPRQLKNLHDTMNDSHIKYCVDTGHMNVSSGMKVGDGIRILGDDIAVLHIQDNQGGADGHCLPPFGDIDWYDTIHALDETGYKGNYNFEVNGRPSLLDRQGKLAYMKYAKEIADFLNRIQ